MSVRAPPTSSGSQNDTGAVDDRRGFEIRVERMGRNLIKYTQATHMRTRRTSTASTTPVAILAQAILCQAISTQAIDATSKIVRRRLPAKTKQQKNACTNKHTHKKHQQQLLPLTSLDSTSSGYTSSSTSSCSICIISSSSEAPYAPMGLVTPPAWPRRQRRPLSAHGASGAPYVPRALLTPPWWLVTAPWCLGTSPGR